MNAHLILLPALLASICAVRPSPDAAPTSSLISLNEKGFQKHTQTSQEHIHSSDIDAVEGSEHEGGPTSVVGSDRLGESSSSSSSSDRFGDSSSSSSSSQEAPKEEERNELDFSSVDNGPLELAAPLKWDVKDRYFGDLLNLQHELDPTAGKVKDMLDKDESHEPMVKDHFEAWLSAADFQRTHGNVEFRKSMEKVLDKVKGEKAIIKDGIEHWKALHHVEKNDGKPWWKPA